MLIQGTLLEHCWCLKCWDIFSISQLCRNASYLDQCKTLVFWCVFVCLFVYLPLFFDIYLVRRPDFIPGVASPSSAAADGEAMGLPSFSLSPCVRHMWSGTVVLELKRFKCFLFCFDSKSIKCIQNPKKRSRAWYIPNTATVASFSLMCCHCFSNAEFT